MSGEAQVAPPQDAPGDAVWAQEDNDAYSFEDSERFEEDSLCSWMSEPESLANNWTGWAQQKFASAATSSNLPPSLSFPNSSVDQALKTGSGTGLNGPVAGVVAAHRAVAKYDSPILPLVELCAKAVARDIPFEVVEGFVPPVPEQLQIRIAFWSFPENEADIRLYSCLANGNVDEFQKGDQLYRSGGVKDLLQIGFHLSASVASLALVSAANAGAVPPLSIARSAGNANDATGRAERFVAGANADAHLPAPGRPYNVRNGGSGPDYFNVAVTLDRRHITSVSCSCGTSASWCAHVVAVCLHRINRPQSACLRAPVSESLSRLQRDQLQKFAQYLINELPQTILPTAQKLLDELLDQRETQINKEPGAPDPTAGASIQDDATWCLDDTKLVDNIRKILTKFCKPAPTVLSDVNYLSSSSPPAATEWQTVLQALKGRTPVGLWNLLSIVREMYRRHDANAGHLLDLITKECLANDAVVVWWFNTKVNQTGYSVCQVNYNKATYGGNSSGAQYSCAFLCDEIVNLWQLAALNPRQSPAQRESLLAQLKSYHLRVIEVVERVLTTGNVHYADAHGCMKVASWIRWFSFETFPGFKPAIEACLLTWDDYHIDGVTYLRKERTGSKAGQPGSMIYVKTNELQGGTLASPTSMSPLSAGAASPSVPVIRDKRITSRRRTRLDTALGGGGRSSGLAPAPLGTHCLDDSAVNSSSDESGEGDLSGPSSAGAQSEEGEFFCPRRGVVLPPNQGGSSLPPPPAATSAPVAHVSRGSSDASSNGGGSTLREGVSGQGFEAEPPIAPGLVDVTRVFGGHNNGPAAAQRNALPGPSSAANRSSTPSEAVMVSASKMKPPDDPFEVKFLRAEALRTHGYPAEALRLAVELATELLSTWTEEEQIARFMQTLPEPIQLPALNTPTKASSGGRKRRGHRSCDSHVVMHPTALKVGNLASATLHKSAFLCAILTDRQSSPLHSDLAVRVALAGLEMIRQPAPTKFLEVQMNLQESELVDLLRKTSLSPPQMDAIREKAKRLSTGYYIREQQPVFPYNLAGFVFEALTTGAQRYPADEIEGFAAVVEALGAKLCVTEQEHPLLCEGLRRQRGDLAQTLLLRYKEYPERIAVILDRFLDRDVHTMYKSGESNAAYYASQLKQGIALLESVVGPMAAATPAVQTPSSAAGGISRNLSALSLTDQDSDLLSARDEPPPSSVRRNLAAKSDLMQSPSSDGGCSTASSVLTMSLDRSLTAVDSGAARRQDSAQSDTAVNRKLSFGYSVESADLCRESSVAPKRYAQTAQQPSEAQAHFMLELAKTLLTKAGGSHSTAIFTAAGPHGGVAVPGQIGGAPGSTGPHRGLHLCAFQIGLYALGIHNRVYPNWLSRTYSFHVSWITGQAIEIGRVALRILMDTWEQHLTPTELATLADKASQGRDSQIVAAAAELALCALPHAHALNPTEIQRALTQCADQSTAMLEKACVAIETAAREEGVYPEVLFMVAKKWYKLCTDSLGSDPPQGEAHRAVNGQHISYQPVHHYRVPPPAHNVGQFGPPTSNVGLGHGSSAQLLPIAGNIHGQHSLYMGHGQPAVSAGGMSLPGVVTAPESPMVGVHPHHHPPSISPAVVSCSPNSFVVHPAVVSAPNGAPQHHMPPFPGQLGGPHVPGAQQVHQLYGPGQAYAAVLPPNSAALGNVSAAQAMGHPNFFRPHVSQQHAAVAAMYHHQYQQSISAAVAAAAGHHQGGAATAPPPAVPHHAFLLGAGAGGGGMHHNRPPPQQQQQPGLGPGGHPQHQQQHGGRIHVSHSAPTLTPPPQVGLGHAHPHAVATMHGEMASGHSRYLLNAYRVGMLAMETMGRRIHDDNRNYVKYARNPPYGDDVKWLFEIAKKLGVQFVQQYCVTAAQSVVSPFVLYDLAVEAANFLRGPTTPVSKAMLHPHVNPLMERCLQMFHEASTQKLSHPRFTPADNDELIALVTAAKTAYHQTVGGENRFVQFLHSLKRQKACKKDIWNRLLTILNQGPVG